MQSKEQKHQRGRGAQFNPPNPFDHLVRDEFSREDEDFEVLSPDSNTQYIETHAKSIVNRVDSPDIGLAWSMNPYQGCEHGCVYCYARNTHTYWGYSAGVDFEKKILVKRNAPELLARKLSSKNWQGEPIMFSGNTDCYQPVELKLEITRKMLEVLWQFRHPVGLITKNSLILRDLDILREMARHDLVKVSISINGMDEKIRSLLEPRTATFKKRLDTIRTLSDAGIPVNAMIAPVIPGLNDHEIFDTVKAVADAGARTAHHIVVRLNGDVRAIFEDWVERVFPDRAAKIIGKISAMHGGTTNDSRFHTRMRGEGQYAEMIADQMRIARNQHFDGRHMPLYNSSLYRRLKDPQLKLFSE